MLSVVLFGFVETDMLAELSRREKAANIKPDPDIDIYMKVTNTDINTHRLFMYLSMYVRITFEKGWWRLSLICKIVFNSSWLEIILF